MRRARSTEGVRRLRAQREASGLCGGCGLVACEPGRVCDACREAARVNAQVAYSAAHPGARVYVCSQCQREGHNARSCGRVAA